VPDRTLAKDVPPKGRQWSQATAAAVWTCPWTKRALGPIWSPKEPSGTSILERRRFIDSLWQAWLEQGVEPAGLAEALEEFFRHRHFQSVGRQVQQIGASIAEGS
jgi:hypothetical protein